MTDECFDPNAERECGNALEAALKIDSMSIEALQTMASYKISQQFPEQAKDFLLQSYQGWKYIHDPAELPEFEFRVQTAKLFMELDDFHQASTILESLLNEDDEIAELWYLLGFSLTNLEPENSLTCLKKSRELLVKTSCSERDIFEQVDEHIETVTKLIQEQKVHGIGMEEEDDEEKEDDMFEPELTSTNPFSIYSTPSTDSPSVSKPIKRSNRITRKGNRRKGRR
eukprot:TRINITY_DN5877_c0_g1_i3.p1 TRINITY_DN5877_c0_g1~~TRINITY_DN5877_c0_g1_i3.p1  ORF type:complete len:227 (+),score=44.30 TRINITY_DN5877_c0_g1_i3:831-1511(+)